MAEHEPAPERPADRNPARPTNRFALASMLLGLLAVLLTVSGCLCPLVWAFTPVGWAVAPVAAVLAMVFGFIARGQFQYADRSAGSRMATSGIVMGGLTVVLSLALLLGSYLGWGVLDWQDVGSPPPQEPTGRHLNDEP
ncbi:MAG: hypothetical protein WD534_03880 [Phycisphaeraceae bacterium]